MSAWNRGLKNSELHIVGFDLPESVKAELRKSDIIIHGRVNHDQLIKAFHDCDCFIFPSITEGFGLVLLQSISCGTPIIGSYNSAAPDLVKSHGVGMSINPFSVDEIYQSMVLASENPDIVSKWSSNCREARKYYSWNRFHREITSCLA